MPEKSSSIRPCGDDVVRAAMRCMAGPHVWGTRDCCTVACDTWAVVWDRPDPMTPLRGTYTTRLGAARAMRRDGTYADTARNTFAAHGLVPVPRAKTGDLAVLRLPVGDVMAICVAPETFMAKTEQGLVAMAAPVVEAWSWPS